LANQTSVQFITCALSGLIYSVAIKIIYSLEFVLEVGLEVEADTPHLVQDMEVVLALLLDAFLVGDTLLEVDTLMGDTQPGVGDTQPVGDTLLEMGIQFEVVDILRHKRIKYVIIIMNQFVNLLHMHEMHFLSLILTLAPSPTYTCAHLHTQKSFLF